MPASLLVVGLGLASGLSIPAQAAPPPAAPAPQAPALIRTVARIDPVAPSYKGGTEQRFRGTLTTDTGAPLPGAPLDLFVDGNLERPVHATTDPAGNFEVAIPPIWVMGQHHVQVRYAGDAEHAATDALTPVMITSRELPVTVHVSADTPRARQGQQVTVSGEAKIESGAPLVGASVFLTIDPGEAPTAKTSTDEHGRFETTFTVPMDAGSWAEPFPGYTVLVHTDELEDWVSTSTPLHFTLTGQPVARPASPTPAAPTPRRNVAPAGSGFNSGSGSGEAASQPDTRPGAVTASSWRLVPDLITWGQLAVGGAILCCVVGAALLSHGRRLRKP